MRYQRSLTLILGLLLNWCVADADEELRDDQDAFDLPQLVAVQGREHYFVSGITMSGGYLPVDSFNKSLTLGIGYTYYLNDYLAWEIVNANYAFNQETDLKHDLQSQFNAEVERVGFSGILDYPTYYITTNMLYTPIYNKSLFFNQNVIHGETSFILGGGIVNYEHSGPKPLVSVGALFRYFTSPTTSMVLDVREHLYFDGETGMNGILAINLGFSFQLGRTPASQDVVSVR